MRKTLLTLASIFVSLLSFLIIGIATVSISGVRAEDKLRRAAAMIETLTHNADDLG